MFDSTRPSPWSARIVLVAGILLGVAGTAATLLRQPHLLGVDLKVYYVAARAALAGGDFYAASPAGHPYSYVYPPVTIPAFYPLALLDSWRAAFAVYTLFNVACALGAAVLLVKFTERYRGTRLARTDRALVGAYVLLSLHSAPSLLYGETNFPLLLAIVAGFWWLDETDESAKKRETLAGVAFALPAIVKVFPAILGIWLLRRRAWRAVAAATATGVGAFAVGVAAFGVETHLTYVRVALLPRLSNEAFVGGLDPTAELVTLRRPLSVLFPSLPPSAYGVLAFLLLAPVVIYSYRRIGVAPSARRGGDGSSEARSAANHSSGRRPREGAVGAPVERLVAVFVTVIAMVVGFPSLMLYFAFAAFPMVPLLYLLESGGARSLFVAGAFVANFALTAAHVESLVTETPIPDATLAVLDPALALATPPLYGAVLMLAGCVLAVRRTAPTPARPS